MCRLQQLTGLLMLMCLLRDKKTASTVRGLTGPRVARLAAMMEFKSDNDDCCQSTVNYARHVAHCDSDDECVPTSRHAVLTDMR